MWTGNRLLRRSVVGLLETGLLPEDVGKVCAVIDRYRSRERVRFEAVRTRESGRHRFVHLTAEAGT